MEESARWRLLAEMCKKWREVRAIVDTHSAIMPAPRAMCPETISSALDPVAKIIIAQMHMPNAKE